MKRSTFWFVLAGMSAMLAGPLAAAEPTAEDYITYHMPLLGDWKASAEEAGKVYSGDASWRLAAGGKCFLLRVNLAGRPGDQDLVGYDPAAKKLLDISVGTDGSLSLSTLEIPDLKPGQVMSVGPVGKWEYERIAADGAA
ncbi:MAG: hypothetical protein KJZ87_26950, partial [Thermoguttaceae bacterium]|nr:hypothetical protein [Thermoguttaceae bacterium]